LAAMDELAGIEAVTFDVGGTLINPWPSVGDVYVEVAAEFGVTASPEFINWNFKDAWKSRHNFDYTQESWFDIVRQSFGMYGAELPEEFFPAVYERFAQPDVWIVYGDVVRTLEDLAASELKLGIISNWDDRLIPLLERLGLKKYFDTIIVSCNVGFTKPSPVIFEQAVRWLKVRPENLLHVGDSPKEDIEGAKAAGFHTRQIARGRRALGEEQIGTLLNVLKILSV
jgi:putative hydrolase of the HAD superfamily